MITITKIFTFDAAHKLPYHKGKCQHLHGHTYKLEVTVKSTRLDDGMIIDFGKLKEVVNIYVLDKLDHAYLNNQWDNPTAEIMIHNIAETIDRNLPELVSIHEVKLWETPTSYATWNQS